MSHTKQNHRAPCPWPHVRLRHRSEDASSYRYHIQRHESAPFVQPTCQNGGKKPKFVLISKQHQIHKHINVLLFIEKQHSVGYTHLVSGLHVAPVQQQTDAVRMTLLRGSDQRRVAVLRAPDSPPVE